MRGSRQDHVARILTRLTGAEAALVVNNNAGAVLLALAALAEGREVIVSRGELIEIGDGFRIPDVLARSGARLVEVGTTNRTRAADYERAIGERHCAAPARAPVELPRRRLRRAPDAAPSSPRSRARRSCRSSTTSARARSSTSATSRPLATSLAAGADLVCFSGDKLLGGPQAGIVVGRAELVSELRRHPAAPRPAHRQARRSPRSRERSLCYLDPERACARCRCCGCCARTPASSERAPSGSPRATGGEVEETVARVGGGALPLPSCRRSRARSKRRSRGRCATREPPVVGILRDGRLLLDCRTLTDDEADEVAAAVRACR